MGFYFTAFSCVGLKQDNIFPREKCRLVERGMSFGRVQGLLRKSDIRQDAEEGPN